MTVAPITKRLNKSEQRVIVATGEKLASLYIAIDTISNKMYWKFSVEIDLYNRISDFSPLLM